MSVFRSLTTKVSEKDCLIKGLESMGYKPVDGENQEVRGHGYEKFKGDVVLKKEDTKLRGDVGFKKQTDGTYKLVYDTYVISSRELDSDKFIKEVTLEYNKAQIKKKMKTIPGYKLVVDKESENGEYKMRYVQSQVG